MIAHIMVWDGEKVLKTAIKRALDETEWVEHGTRLSISRVKESAVSRLEKSYRDLKVSLEVAAKNKAIFVGSVMLPPPFPKALLTGGPVDPRLFLARKKKNSAVEAFRRLSVDAEIFAKMLESRPAFNAGNDRLVELAGRLETLVKQFTSSGKA